VPGGLGLASALSLALFWRTLFNRCSSSAKRRFLHQASRAREDDSTNPMALTTRSSARSKAIGLVAAWQGAQTANHRRVLDIFPANYPIGQVTWKSVP